MKENLKFFPVMIKWVGFPSTVLDVKHSKRSEGKSSYSFRKLLNLSIDVVVSFTDKPLKIMVSIGLIISLLSVITALYIFSYALFYEYKIEGWASLMISLWFIGGIIMMMIGIVGIYIGKTFDEAKQRQTYIINHTINFKS